MILRLDNFRLLEFAISSITVDIREKMMIDHRRFWYKFWFKIRQNTSNEAYFSFESSRKMP